MTELITLDSNAKWASEVVTDALYAEDILEGDPCGEFTGYIEFTGGMFYDSANYTQREMLALYVEHHAVDAFFAAAFAMSHKTIRDLFDEESILANIEACINLEPQDNRINLLIAGIFEGGGLPDDFTSRYVLTNVGRILSSKSEKQEL